MITPHNELLLKNIADKLLARQWKIVTAESCTAGGLAYTLTSLPGSSTWFDRGFVTYSNDSKEKLVHVTPTTLLRYGAVSAETATEMATGALENSSAQLSIAITGIAGPDGGTVEKPVGTVWFGIVSINQPVQTVKHVFEGDRTSIREQSIEIALKMLASW